MMYKILGLVLIPFFLISQNPYAVDSIPSSLKENVDAVIRLERTDFEIKDISSAYLKRHTIVTVFNERGAKKYQQFYTHYDNLSKVKDISGIVYDKQGKKIYKLTKKDFFDVSSSALSNAVTDNRIKVSEFDHKNFEFPYTIDFSSSLERKNMMFYPSDCFYALEHISIQEETIVIETPLDFTFRFKERNMPGKGTIVMEGNKKKYTWSIKNISSMEYEPFTPFDSYPEILSAPKKFSVENYSGDIESWGDLSKFFSKLYEGRDVLPDSIKLKVNELTKNEKDTLKKIEILYHYLQNNTRYMSIQLGMGGWQTITAMEVSSKGYGDCKALSNYMKALLKEVGVSSIIALIKAGSNENRIETDFPNANFNHVVICVPLKKDTIWLECTSQNNAMGYQGSFTGNRKALLILPEGGALVNTCKYSPLDNTQSRKATLFVDELGNAKAQIKTVYKGIEQENENYILHEKSIEQQKKLLQNRIPLNSFEIDDFYLKEYKSRIPELEEYLNLRIAKLANQTGKRFFLKPNILNHTFISLPELKTRKCPFYLSPTIFNRQEIDSLNFNMPLNFDLEFMPTPVSINTKFGEYAITIYFKNGVLSYYRKLTLHEGYFSATEYTEWLDFINKINKMDQLQIAFKIKKE